MRTDEDDPPGTAVAAPAPSAPRPLSSDVGVWDLRRGSRRLNLTPEQRSRLAAGLRSLRRGSYVATRQQDAVDDALAAAREAEYDRTSGAGSVSLEQMMTRAGLTAADLARDAE